MRLFACRRRVTAYVLVVQQQVTKDMKIISINFNKEHKAMLGHCKILLEHESRKIAINPDKFDKLTTALTTAVDNDGTLDKGATPYNDVRFEVLSF